MDEADVVVIGSGSAGSAVAGRLSEVAGLRVTVVEAGSTDSNIWLHVPIGYAKTMYHPTISWNYATEPEPGLGGRSVPWPRGRVLGGSSAINGLIYIRGQAEDYDMWRQMGCTGWGFEDCLPWFKRAQNQERGGSDLHGGAGPLSTTDLRDKGALSQAFIDAALELGFPRNDDFNGPDQEGAGWYQVTVKDGFRHSAASAYLKPAVKAGRVRLITDAQVTRLLIEEGRAVGVEYRLGGETRSLRAAREVVLSGGAINSPQVMMLSGLGPAEHLHEMGIPVLRDMPEVGRNLQDHYQARLMYRANASITMNEVLGSWLGMARTGLQYALTRRGPLTFAAATSGLFARVLPQSATPDVQFHFIPWSADSVKEGLHKWPGFTLSVCQLRPESRGALTLASPDPMAKPKMFANYLATETDRQCLTEGVKLARRLARTRALGSLIESEHTPGPAVPDSDDALLEFARQKGGTIYHPTSTCRMGADERSVVDVELRVRGVERLRIADASIMPAVVSGNTNAGCIMIGERCAEFIKRAA
jgi:choline dehydrogenase